MVALLYSSFAMNVPIALAILFAIVGAMASVALEIGLPSPKPTSNLLNSWKEHFLASIIFQALTSHKSQGAKTYERSTLDTMPCKRTTRNRITQEHNNYSSRIIILTWILPHIGLFYQRIFLE